MVFLLFQSKENLLSLKARATCLESRFLVSTKKPLSRIRMKTLREMKIMIRILIPRVSSKIGEMRAVRRVKSQRKEMETY